MLIRSKPGKPGLISGILNYIYPSDCPLCGNNTDNVKYAPLCIQCWSGIKRYSGPSCRVCGTPFSSEYSDLCAGCRKKPPFFSRAMSFGIYDNALATAINLYKFHGARRLHRQLGKFLLQLEIPRSDGLVQVPLSIKGLRARGFNQSLLLAKVVSDNAKIPLFMDGLVKKKETLPQVGLSGKERVSNLKGAFMAGRDFTGMRLMLIDDVMTTGATANECSKQLLKAGAEDVTVLTLARAGCV